MIGRAPSAAELASSAAAAAAEAGNLQDNYGQSGLAQTPPASLLLCFNLKLWQCLVLKICKREIIMPKALTILFWNLWQCHVLKICRREGKREGGGAFTALHCTASTLQIWKKIWFSIRRGRSQPCKQISLFDFKSAEDTLKSERNSDSQNLEEEDPIPASTSYTLSPQLWQSKRNSDSQNLEEEDPCKKEYKASTLHSSSSYYTGVHNFKVSSPQLWMKG